MKTNITGTIHILRIQKNVMFVWIAACLVFPNVPISSGIYAQTKSVIQEGVDGVPANESDPSEGSAVAQELSSADQVGREEVKDTTEIDQAGQADLDRAFELKLTASSTRDLDSIADLCESAIEKGLDIESEKQAKALWASVLFNYAKQLDMRIAPKNKLSTRWRWLRQQAITRLEKAIELRPEKIDALVLLAELHSLKSGDRDAALESIEKAIALIKDDKIRLAKALYIRSRLAENEKARIADLSQAVKIDPGNFEALLERAIYLLENGKNEEAVEDFKKMVAIDKTNADRFIFVAQALRQKQLNDEAISILNAAIDANPQNDKLLVLRAQTHLAVEDEDKALDDLNRALEVNRQNVGALNIRARVYVVEKEFEKALSDANELIQQQPDQSSGYELRSLVYRAQAKLDKAIEDIEYLLEKDPGDLDLQFDIAMLYTANDQPSKAIPIYDYIIEQISKAQTVNSGAEAAQTRIYRNRADAYLSLGEHQRAIDDYEVAIELIEEFSGSQLDGMSDEREKDMKAGLLNNLAWVLATSTIDEVRDGQRALELATEAAELSDFKAAYILSTLAACYAELGDFETAKKWSVKAIDLAESDEQRGGLEEELASYQLGKAWREMDNVEADSSEEPDQKNENKSPDKSAEDKIQNRADEPADSSESNGNSGDKNGG